MSIARSASLLAKVGLVAGATWLAAPALGAVEAFVVDDAHSKVGFEIPHLVVSTVEGRFAKFGGTFDFDPDAIGKDPAAAGKFKLDAWADTASIDTGVKKRDDHLRSPDFFDAKKFPKLTFKSKSVSDVTEKGFKMTGDLTMHGVTKEVAFDVKYKGKVMANDKLHVAFEAKTSVKRKDFGLMWNNVVEAGPVVGDEADITLKVEGIRKKDAAE
jgi:polyisoprenoid-binding protein YceI